MNIINIIMLIILINKKMKNASKKFYYLFLSIIFQTLSVLSMKFYLSLFKDEKSHPYILTTVYFVTYLLFIIIFILAFQRKKMKKIRIIYLIVFLILEKE